MLRHVACIFPVDLLCTKPQLPFLFSSGLLQVIVNLCTALTHCKPAVTHTPAVLKSDHNHPGLCIHSPVEHVQIQMGDVHTPHSVQPGGAHRMQVRVSTMYFIHVHDMYIALHHHCSVHLCLVWSWFCIGIDEPM